MKVPFLRSALVGFLLAPPVFLPASTPPLDYEQWRREHPRPAAKRLADLDVGEPRTVRMIYFLPNDRPYRAGVVDSMKTTIRQVQTFYAEQMQAHGHGEKIFRFETDDQDEPRVHRVDGQHPDSHYLDDTFGTVIGEIHQVFDLPASNIYFIVIDNSTNLIDRRADGVAENSGKMRGEVLVTGGFGFETAAHELGHAFGLDHDFRDDGYIMSYGQGRNRLSRCSAEFLAGHPYFNPDTGEEETNNSTIELVSPLEYPLGSTSVPVQLQVSDPEGLHQVALFVETRRPHPGAGFLEAISCRGLNGETDAAVEFEYNGIFPSDGSTSLFDPVVHPVHVRAIDADGNVSPAEFTLRAASAQGHVATLEGHRHWVLSVAFSPDGKTLASGSYDNIRLWDVETGTNTTTFSGFIDALSVAFSPDGTILASGSQDFAVRLWDAETGRVIATLEEHTDEVPSVAFSPDGTILASGSRDRTIKLWEVVTGDEIATLERHADVVLSVAFSPDGTILASGSQDRTIKLWEVVTGDEIATLEGHGNWIRSVAFSPDGSTLASAAYSDDTVRLWDVATGQRIATFSGGIWGFNSVVFSPDGSVLAAGSGDRGDGTIELWDVATGSTVTTLAGHTGGVHSVAFSPDGSTLASGAWDNTVKLWDVSEFFRPRPRVLVKIEGDNQKGPPNAELDNLLVVEVRDQFGNVLEGAVVDFSVTDGNGKLKGKYTVAKATTDDDGLAKQTLTLGSDPGTNTVEASLAGIEPVTFHAVGVGTPTPSTGDFDHRTVSLPEGALTRFGKGVIGEGDRAIAFSPDSRLLAVASGIGVWLYEVSTSRELALLSGHEGVVTTVAFSPDGSLLASGSSDQTVKLWDLATGQEMVTLGQHGGWVLSVAFSPDGSTLASGSSTFRTGEGVIRLWEVATGRNIAALEGHRSTASEVSSLAFSPDGSLLASGSGDQTVKLWDLATNQDIATLEQHSWIATIAFSPDGTTLASGSEDGTLTLWDVATGQSIKNFRHIDDWLGWPIAVNSVVFSPDGTTLVSGFDDGTLKLRDVATGILGVTLEGHAGIVNSVAFSPDGSTVAAGTNSRVNLWDVATHNSAILTGHTSWVTSVAFSPDGKAIGVGRADGTTIWNVDTHHRVFSEKYQDEVNFVRFSPDGAIFASAAGAKIFLLNVETGDRATLSGHRNQINVLAFSPDGRTLASGADDGMVKLWDVTTGQNTATFGDPADLVYSVTFSPDGTNLVSETSDGIFKLWDVATGTHISTLEEPPSWIMPSSLSPDGRTRASREKNAVKLWDVASGRILTTLNGHTDVVRSVAFSPDGTILVSGSRDGTVLLWDMQRVVPAPRTATTLARLSGDGQQGSPGAPLADPFLVSVQDQNGEPLAGATVTFDVTAGDGTLSATTVTTDEQGRAAAILTLGSEAKSYTVEVTVAGLDPILFTATAKVVASTLRKLFGDEQEAPARNALSEPFQVQVLDPNDHPLEGVEVTFTVTAGGGTVSATTVTTEEDGVASTILTLGSQPGTHIVEATVAGLDPVTFTATAKANSDFDGDGEIGFSDFFLFADAFGGSDPRFDLDGSGSVDFADFFLLADYFADPARGKLLALAREMIGLPDGPQLQQNHPNPFNSQTVISWFQLLPGPARVEVFALTGQRVAVLHQGPKKAGVHRVNWDGRDNQGRPLASGVYLYRLVTTQSVQTRKLTLLR